jgi:hypothetical protein
MPKPAGAATPHPCHQRPALKQRRCAMPDHTRPASAVGHAQAECGTALARDVVTVDASPARLERWRSRLYDAHTRHDATAPAFHIAAGVVTMPASTEHDARYGLWHPALARNITPVSASPVTTERWRSRPYNAHTPHDATASACHIEAGVATMSALIEHDARHRRAGSPTARHTTGRPRRRAISDRAGARP